MNEMVEREKRVFWPLQYSSLQKQNIVLQNNYLL